MKVEASKYFITHYLKYYLDYSLYKHQGEQGIKIASKVLYYMVALCIHVLRAYVIASLRI